MERIVYVVCSSDTLARDLRVLVNEHGHVPRAAGIMDMFPRTAHIESIALPSRDEYSVAPWIIFPGLLPSSKRRNLIRLRHWSEAIGIPPYRTVSMHCSRVRKQSFQGKMTADPTIV